MNHEHLGCVLAWDEGSWKQEEQESESYAVKR
jgi:hypothetical protein